MKRRKSLCSRVFRDFLMNGRNFEDLGHRIVTTTGDRQFRQSIAMARRGNTTDDR